MTKQQISPPGALSPSAAAQFTRCPAAFRYRRILRLPDPSGEPAVRGTLVHRVLEELMAVPCANRTAPLVKHLFSAAVSQLSDSSDYMALGLDSEAHRAFLKAAWDCLRHYTRMEDPRLVRVECTELDVTIDVGGVPTRGIIDRVDNTDDGIVVVDYKTGRIPPSRYQHEAFGALRVYSAILSALGRSPVELRLLYLTGGVTLHASVNSEILAATIAQWQDTWADILAAYRSGEFPARPTRLCDWCAFRERCDTDERTRHVVLPARNNS